MLAADRRAHFREGLSSIYLPFYDALCSLLGPEWQPYSGMRDFQAQDALYAKGRTSPPIGIQHRVTKAKGGQSAHNYGCATDWTRFEGETLLWLKEGDPLWAEYRKNVDRAGLYWGGSFGDVDHNEVKMACDWPHVLLCFQQGGMTAAQNHISENMLLKGPPKPTI